jgi:hypothetical protein
VPSALAIQGVVTLAAIVLAVLSKKNPARIVVLAALASPYLHLYDLLGVTVIVALLVQDRLRRGFAPGEPILFFLLWFAPGLLPWTPQYAHATPFLLLLLLASVSRSGGLAACDSSQVPPGSPASSAGPLPIPAPPNSMAFG